MTHIAIVKRLDQRLVILKRADLGIQNRKIDDIVSVRASRPRLEIWRGITMCNTQVRQIGHDRLGVPEGEAGMKLEPIGRFRKTPLRGDPSSGFLQQVVDSIRDG